MSTQDAILGGNRHVRDDGQEREQTVKEEATENRINEIGTVEAMNPVPLPHHWSCCCMSCWSKNINLYL
jgi:hypothetical protein